MIQYSIIVFNIYRGFSALNEVVFFVVFFYTQWYCWYKVLEIHWEFLYVVFFVVIHIMCYFVKTRVSTA